ncbi:hypothetical protein HDE_12968 [Halotydeus destructor]|nr:hypothetical protein HDE_12968 [Halotydeus destructor]
MGNGPQLYGVFEGGETEEFLPSRLYTVNEWADDGQVRAAVDRQMAWFHCMDMPAPKVAPEDFHESVGECYQQYLVTRDKVARPQPMSENHRNCVDELLAFDVMKELEWFKKATPLVAILM